MVNEVYWQALEKDSVRAKGKKMTDWTWMKITCLLHNAYLLKEFVQKHFFQELIIKSKAQPSH